jgi:hypothetical protein
MRTRIAGDPWIVALGVLVILLGFSGGRIAAQSGCQNPCTDVCNFVDGSTGGHHNSATCNQNNQCPSCWCVIEKCASSKCGPGTVEQCTTQEACQLYSSGQLSFCLNLSSC